MTCNVILRILLHHLTVFTHERTQVLFSFHLFFLLATVMSIICTAPCSKQHQILISPYGIVIDTDPSNNSWNGHPLMRFIHTDDLIPFCAGLSAAYKQRHAVCTQHPIRFDARILDPQRQIFSWHEITVFDYSENCLLIIDSLSHKQPNMRGNCAHDASSGSWKHRLHDLIENGFIIVAHALLSLAHILHEHGYHLKPFCPDVVERLLNLLEWSGIIKDVEATRSLLHHYLEHCNLRYMHHAWWSYHM